MNRSNNTIFIIDWLVPFVFCIFILRMAFPGLIWVFIPIFLILCFIFLYYIIFKHQSIKALNFFKKSYEYLLISIFLLFALFLNTSFLHYLQKELFHFISAFFLFFILSHRINSQSDFESFLLKFYTIWVLLLIPIGLFSLLKIFGFIIIEDSFVGTSLVSDNNFFALAFLIGILMVPQIPLIKGQLLIKILLLLLFIIIIIFSASRRGFIVLLLLGLVSSFYIRFKKRNIFIIGLVFILLPLLIFSSKKHIINFSFNHENTVQKIYSISYRYYSIFNQKDSFHDFIDKLRIDNYRYNYFADFNKGNIIQNGNFEMGSLFWTYTADSIGLICKNIDGKNVIEINKEGGNVGYWSLRYIGKPIVFNKGDDIKITLKCKMVTGDLNSFNLGIGYVDTLPLDSTIRLVNLNKKVDSLENGWLMISCFHHFNTTVISPPILINSQINFTRFYITSIEIRNLSQADFLTNFAFNSNTTKNYSFSLPQISFLYSRSELFLFAKQIFSEYTLMEKIIGKGFVYIDNFKNKYGNIYYPHNPALSALLYSGIIGFLIYISYLFKSIILIVKSKKRMNLLGITLIILFFTMTSGNTHFSIPVLIVFTQFPYLYAKKYDIET